MGERGTEKGSAENLTPEGKAAGSREMGILCKDKRTRRNMAGRGERAAERTGARGP